jgi:hypothetical protein
MLFLPVKSGIIATLDDIATGVTDTYVQPGLNITTGGTTYDPVVNLATSIFLTGVTANSISGTSISATTYYSGNTPLNLIIAAVSNPTLDQVLGNGHIALEKNMVLSGTPANGGGSLFVGPAHVFSEADSFDISGSTIIGGWNNTFSGSNAGSNIIGARDSIISGTLPTGHYSNNIVGGWGSTISNTYGAKMLFSNSSLIRDGSDGAMILSSYASTASTNAYEAIIIGGSNNIVQYEDVGGYGTIISSNSTEMYGGNHNVAFGSIGSIFNAPISTVEIGGQYNVFGGSVGVGSFYSSFGSYSGSGSVFGSTNITFLNSYYAYAISSVYSSIINAGGPSVILGAIGSYIVGSTPYDSSLSGNSIIGGIDHVLSGSGIIGAVIVGGYANKLTHSGSTILGGHDQVSDAVDTVFMMNAKASNRITAAVYYSGASELGSLFTATIPTYVQPGLNIATGGTANIPIVSLAGSIILTGVTAQSLSGTSISGTSFYSGSTPFNTILSTFNTNPTTYVQPGLNITTGGTPFAPVVNLAGTINLTGLTAVALSATSISAATYYSGSTPLQTVFASSAHTHVSADITDASYGGNFDADGDKLVKFGPYGNLSASSSGITALNVQAIGVDAVNVTSDVSYGIQSQSNDGIGIYGFSQNNYGIVADSVAFPAFFAVSNDGTNVNDIARFFNNTLVGMLVKNDAGLQWTSPTGAATTRTNLGLSNVFVAPGSNTYTASTVFNTIVGVVGSPVFTAVTANVMSATSISATTYYSGSTPLNTILSTFSTAAATYVQPGLNITTGGTASAPIINVSGTPIFTSVTAVSMTAVTMSANSLVLESYSSNTASSTANGVRLYDRSRAGRNMLETKDAAGVITNFQPHMGMTNVRFVKALGNGGTTLSSFGLSPIIGGTSQPKTYATSSLLASLQRVGMRTTATPSTSATMIFNNGGTAPFWLGNLTNAGGFHAIFRFGIAQAQTNMRWFVGMYSAVTAISNVEPTSLGTILGFGINSGDTNVKFMYNDGSGTASVVDFGAAFPATSANTVYEAHLYATPNSSVVNYYLERLDSTDKIEGSVNTNVPPSTVFLTPHLYINNATTSADAIMDFIQMQVETKY